ncbi:CD276 antigen-like [Brachyhypopomus gauderio]|uniref:CD276 antigen-like n=1 Tax=Brachyhypopomus gauderio TaxID=698409 RepID=UPI004041C3C4
MLWEIYFLCVIMNCAAFKVSTPSSHLVAVRDQPVVLACEFTPDSDPKLSSLVVTWQRQEDSRVVHSFYYGQDQLDRQSADYRNRTALFASELQRGNASLRMVGTGLEDTGNYLCLVSNTKGSGRAQVHLEYGALYTEPRLSINVSSVGAVVRFDTQGFPKPEVQWVDAEGKELPHHTELSVMAVGLWHLRSSYETHTTNASVIFTLKNPRLNQDLQRPVTLAYGEDEAKCVMSRTVIVFSLLVCCVLLVIAVVFLLLKLLKDRKNTWTATNGQSLPLITTETSPVITTDNHLDVSLANMKSHHPPSP